MFASDNRWSQASFTMLHELTHLNYATKSDGVPAAENKRSVSSMKDLWLSSD